MSDKLYDIAIVKYVNPNKVMSLSVVTFIAKSQRYRDAIRIQSEHNGNPMLKGHAEMYEKGILK